MMPVMPMNKQLQKLWRGSLRSFPLALLGMLFAASPSHSQEAETQEDDVFMGGYVSLADLSGKRIDRDWFRYRNTRFGLAIDIPTKGYRYHIPVNGSGLALISEDENEDDRVTITIHTHWVAMNGFPDANNHVEPSIKHLFDEEVADTKANGGTITYSVRKKQFYVVSGTFGDNTFYERLTISPRCPAIFNAMRAFSPTAREREIDKLVTRLSRSLRATCQGDDAAPDNGP
jgi:hypothetical protein